MIIGLENIWQVNLKRQNGENECVSVCVFFCRPMMCDQLKQTAAGFSSDALFIEFNAFNAVEVNISCICTAICGHYNVAV